MCWHLYFGWHLADKHKAGSRKMTLKSGRRAVLSKTALIMLIPVFRKYGFFRR